MRSRCRIVVASMYATVFLGFQAVVAQEGKPAMSAEELAMMEKWGAFMTPGEPHKMLASLAGSWATQTTFWMAPEAPPTTTDGASQLEMILDGRYLAEKNSGMFNEMPFLGNGLTGYDNMKKKYVATWIDNMGTGIMVSEGTYDAASKTFEFMGVAPDPMAGEYKPMKTVHKLAGSDRMVVEMSSPTPDGKGWWKTMEITYTRKK